MHTRRLPAAFLFCAAITCLAPAQSRAVALRRPKDWELATRPVMVVARWTGQPPTTITAYDGAIPFETQTIRIVVERVISGDVTAGENIVAVSAVSLADGRWVQVANRKRVPHWMLQMRLGVDQFPPEVDDATAPSLWMLEATQRTPRGWRPMLAAYSSRSIQPISREAYYRALAEPDRTDRMAPFLRSEDRQVVLGALEIIAGDHEWWGELEFWDFMHKCDNASVVEFLWQGREYRDPAPGYGSELRQLLIHRNPAIRWMAMKTLVWTEQEKSLAAIRQLANDPDRRIRQDVRYAMEKAGQVRSAL